MATDNEEQLKALRSRSRRSPEVLLEMLRSRWRGHGKELRNLIPILKEHEAWHQSEEYISLMNALDPLPDAVGTLRRDLRGAPLLEADLSDAFLEETSLWGADLDGADLSKAALNDTDLSKANLWGANLCDARLEGTKLCGANLDGADLSRAALWNADLSDAHLEGANLYRVHLWKADLTGAYLGGVNAIGAYFREANLSRAFLGSSNLCGANLEHANLSGVEVGLGVRWNANDRTWPKIRHLDFKGKKLDPADRKTLFGGNDIRDVNWAGAALMKRFVEDEIFLTEYIAQEGLHNKIISWLWKWTSDYGRNLGRWLFVALIVALSFGLILYAIQDHLAVAAHNEAPKLATMLYTSIVIFTTLGFGDVTPKTLLAEIIVVIEVIIGYTMLGGLISIFANRFARRA